MEAGNEVVNDVVSRHLLHRFLSTIHLTSHDSYQSSSPISIPTISRISHHVPIPVTHSVSKLQTGTSFPIRTRKLASKSSSSQTSSSSLSSSSSYKKFTSLTFSNTCLIILLTTLILFTTTCSAEYYIEERMVEVREDIPDLFASTLARLARSGTILVDQRPDPSLPREIPAKPKKQWEIVNSEDTDSDLDPDLNPNEGKILDFEDLRKRKEELEKRGEVATITSTATITPPKSTSSASSTSSNSLSTSTVAGSSTSSGLVSAATATSVSLPTVFDSGFSSNITSSCSSFMKEFLANETFISCLPFSLLLQNSNSFFQASKSIVRITQTLDASCSANLQTCTALMTSLASNLTSTTNCATDLSAANPLITQAQLGLLAYNTMYTASCLKNPSTAAYCYAEAVTNASSPTDTYVYYLPLNVSLPGGSQPTCNKCLQNTMQVFEAASSVRSSAIAGDYVEAAGMVNVQCGPGFVNASLAAAVATGGAGRIGGEGLGMGVAGLVMLWVVVWGWLI